MEIWLSFLRFLFVFELIFFIVYVCLLMSNVFFFVRVLFGIFWNLCIIDILCNLLVVVGLNKIMIFFFLKVGISGLIFIILFIVIVNFF